MKPLRILIFFVAVFGLLLGLSVIFPQEGISLGGELKLQFASSTNLFARDSASSEYTDSLIQHATVTDDPEEGIVDTLFMLTDTLFMLTDSVPDVNLDSIIRARIDSIRKRVYPIEFAENAKEPLYRFFSSAETSLSSNELIRILHYGDSQIENDRMTSLLRYRFQKVFGGSGCGMVPAVPLYFGNPTFTEDATGDWIRYTGFGNRDSTITHNCYGLLTCYTSVPVVAEDKLPSVEFAFRPGRRASRFTDLNIFLHAYVDSGMVIARYNDTITDTIAPLVDGYNHIQRRLDLKAEKVKLEFALAQGGRIYGISFDSPAGVQMDNIAMRGSSGLEFSRTDRDVLDTMLQAVNPGLIIMQFGGNVVPYITNASYYQRTFRRELNTLKSICPDIPIVVIGPSDMSTKVNGQFTTYETLEPVRNALRQAALETGCAFWDMYEAMGGRNSIQDFVLADPPLATSDYIHFTPRGANLMAGMFFDAMMLEYGKYKRLGIER